MEKQGKRCRVCGSTRNAKWGKRKGKQAYRCSDCGFQFTREDERKSEKDVLRAVALYCYGFSFCTIGTILNYHNTTIMKWIRHFAESNYQKPVPKSEIIIELDEMHHYIGSKKTQYGFGKRIAEQIDSFLIGNWEIEIPEHLKSCIIV